MKKVSLAIPSNQHSHAPSRSLAPWGTRRARALRIGVFDKRDSHYQFQSIQTDRVKEPHGSMGDETTYPGGILETHLADIESLALPILANWCDGPPRALRNDRQLVVLSAYLAVVHAQLPTISVQLREFDTTFAGDHVTSSEVPLRALSSARTDVASNGGDPIGEIRRALGEDDVRLEMRPNEAAWLSLHVPEAAFRAFRAMRWRLVGAPEGSEFITSDAPVNVLVLDEPNLGLDEALISPHAEVTFPLSPRMCLLGRRAWPRGGPCSPGVREVNDRQVHSAERFVYFRKQTGAVEQSMEAVWPKTESDLTHVGEFGALLIRGVRPSPRRPRSG